MGYKDEKDGHREYFENLFQEHADVIYRLCFYKTNSESVARDLTQETFMRVWKTVSSDNVISKPKQYLYQIARNLIVDHYKSAKDVSLEKLQEEGFDPEARENSPEVMSDTNILKSAIEDLEADFRGVIYLKFVEDMRTKEIAEMLNLSENLVSVRLNRGKKKLQEKFKQD